MDIKRSQCLKCDGDVVVDTGFCPKCATSLKFFQKSNPNANQTKRDTTKTPEPMETNYVMQIVSSRIRPDSVYEAQMLLAPDVDLSSIKITIKGNNLRVNVSKPLSEEFANQLPQINEKSIFGDLIKRIMKHCENLLIPDGIDNGKVRAVVDSKNRMLVLTAPAVKPSQTKRKLTEKS